MCRPWKDGLRGRFYSVGDVGSTEGFKHGRDRISPFHGECGRCWKDSIERRKKITQDRPGLRW